jgi:uncharacterized protein YggU (UPF0235/DUF167 family)
MYLRVMNNCIVKDSYIQVNLKEKACDNKANEALVSYISRKLEINVDSIKIVRGL